jgi:hypothetical protein
MPFDTKTGDALPRDLAQFQSSVATMTALKAIPTRLRYHGLRKLVEADQSVWMFHSTSALTGDDILVASPASGSGAWLRVVGRAVLRLPCTFATADAAALLTVPTGCELRLAGAYWEITTSWTGGSSSAIGLSSSKTGYDTAGDILGGASGNVLAELTTALSPTPGTIGAKMDTVAELNAAILIATNTIRFNRITSVFTAGAGNGCLIVDILKNAGA